MKKDKIINIIFIAIFASMIILPTAMVNRDENAISTIENKKLANFPSLEDKDMKSFMTGVENWFNDNIAFKEKAITLNLNMKWKLFKDYDVPNFLMGKEGHTYYTSGDQGIKTFQGKDKVSEEAIKDLSDGILAMRNFYEREGSKFYFMPIPDKEQIYPEYYPDSIKRYNNRTKMDDLEEYIAKNTDVNICDIEQALLDAKEAGSDLLYYKNVDSTHWNNSGAMVGYEAIMSMIKKDFPELQIKGRDFFVKSESILKGSLGSALLLQAISLSETEEDKYAEKLPIFTAIEKYSFEDDYIPFGIKIDKVNNYHHWKNEAVNNEKTMMIIGDSYVRGFMLPYFAENFSEVYFIQASGNHVEKDLYFSIKPDIVIYEFVERASDFGGMKYIYDQYKLMAPDKNVFEVEGQYEVAPELYIEGIDDIENKEIFIEEGIDFVNITGVAIDYINGKSYGEIYLKAGENYYKGAVVQRQDMVDSTGNNNFINAGFSFTLHKGTLKNIDTVEIIVLSNDFKYQYQPIVYTIKK